MFSAPDQCDCGENEECYDGECVCEEGYEISQYGDCVWPDDGEIISYNYIIALIM